MCYSGFSTREGALCTSLHVASKKMFTCDKTSVKHGLKWFIVLIYLMSNGFVVLSSEDRHPFL